VLWAVYIGCMLMVAPFVVGSDERAVGDKESIFDGSEFSTGKDVRLGIDGFQVLLSPTPTRLNDADESVVVQAIQNVINTRGITTESSWRYATIEVPVVENIFKEDSRWLRRRLQTKTTTLVLKGGDVSFVVSGGEVGPDVSAVNDIVKTAVNEDLVTLLNRNADYAYITSATYTLSTKAPTASPSAAPSAAPIVSPTKPAISAEVEKTKPDTTEETLDEDNNGEINLDDTMAAQGLNTDESNTSSGKDGLGKGGIVGVTFAALLVAAVLAGLVIRHRKRIHEKFLVVDGTKSQPESDEDETYQEDITGSEGHIIQQRDQNIPSPPRPPNLSHLESTQLGPDDLSTAEDASVVSDWTMSTATGDDSFALKTAASLLTPGGAHPMMCAESFELNRHRQGQIHKDLLHTTPGWEPPTSSIPSPKNVKNNTVLKPSSFLAAEETTQQNNLLTVSTSSGSDPDDDDMKDLSLVVESPVMFDKNSEDMLLTPPSVVGSKMRKMKR